MDNNKLWENISTKIAGESTNADEAAVKVWMESDADNKKVFNRLLEMWQYNPKQIHDNTTIYRKYQHRKQQFKQRKVVTPFMYYAVRISAVIFFLVASTFIVSQYVLNNDEIVYQEIFVPKGSRTSMKLPDGSKVWLSNNSSIKYPTNFKGETRELELRGEAYFEVRHNKKKPFVVNVGENRIKVLGTRFSLTAYPEDNILRADLVEGKIQLDINDEKGGYHSYTMRPSQSLIFDKNQRKLVESTVTPGFYDYWHKGIYEFRNESLEELAVKIDRIYNTQIVFEDEELKNRKFSGTISINDNVFTFIEAVKETSIESIDYRYERNKLYVKLK